MNLRKQAFISGTSYKQLRQERRNKIIIPKRLPFEKEEENEKIPLEEKEIKNETKHVLEENSDKIFDKIEKIEKKKLNKKQIKNKISSFLT